MRWRVILEPEPETGECTAWRPELPGCTSTGTTEQEAAAKVGEAIEFYVMADA